MGSAVDAKCKQPGKKSAERLKKNLPKFLAPIAAASFFVLEKQKRYSGKRDRT